MVIPTWDEAENLPWVLGCLPDVVTEIVVVDGLSTDGTVERARALCPSLKVVYERRPGKGAALRRGFEEATGDYVVMLDADGSMDPAEIPRFLQPLREGADLAKGSRFLAGGGSDDITLVRRLGNTALRSFANLAFGCRQTDLCYGFMAMRRDAIEAMALDADGFEIETQIVVHSVRAGLRVAEVPSFELMRRAGRSRLKPLRDGTRILRTMLQARRITNANGQHWPEMAAQRHRHDTDFRRPDAAGRDAACSPCAEESARS